MNKCFLVCDVHGVHLDVGILEVVEVHVVCGPNKELLLLLHTHILLPLPLILLLDLHVPILVFAVRKCMIQALSVVPSLLCILLSGTGTLRSRCMRQLEVIVFAVLIRVHRDRLHVEATAIH